MPVSVLLLSIGSLYVALHTGSAMDKLVAHNEKLVKAQSTPILQYGTSNYEMASERHALSFSVGNVGTGPARVHWVRVRDGDKLHAHFQPWLLAQASDAEKPAVLDTELITSDIDGGVLPVRESRQLLFWLKPSAEQALAHAVWERANQSRGKLRVEVCYCSVFDECWEHRFGDGPAKPVAQCTAPPKSGAG
jgi:hypothetical protein